MAKKTKPTPKKKTTVKYPKEKDRATIPVTSLKHKDKRVNIPTEELRDFVAEEEKAPKAMLYPRDPSLDPQLVWMGKDEQDAKPLEVPVVPIYIQEKIHPQAIIQQVKAAAKKEAPDQSELFSDFNNIQFEDLIEFYQHEQNWTNRAILGDSLLVMTSLAEKERLKGKVQTIYLDPPYGIKFGSNWQVSTRKRDVKDGKVEDASRQPEQVKAYRDTWKLGIHSYLAYLRDRFVVARELLTESGSIFVQISDENLHLVRSILDEVFGSENFALIISYQKTGGIPSNLIAPTMDFILWYCKNKSVSKYRPLFQERMTGDTSLDRYDMIEEDDGIERRILTEEIENPDLLKGRRFQLTSLFSDGASPNGEPSFSFHSKEYYPSTGKHWTTKVDGLYNLAKAERIREMGTVLRYRRFIDDFPVKMLTDRWDSVQLGEQRVYVVQTSVLAIQRCILMTTDPGDLVLDPTCGSGTTAYVAEQWGRRWITVDTSRVALALARTRLMAAKYPYYYLSDSNEGIKKEQEVTRILGSSLNITPLNDIKKGFVNKRVPHITLKAIANNEEIDAIYNKWIARMEPIRGQLNKQLKKSWEEWQIPYEVDEKWSEEGKQLHSEWWQMRRARQKETDESITRHADYEMLYDQPYEDNKRIRVAGPFTVESLSPHRVLATDEERPESEKQIKKEAGVGQFENMIISHLKTAGVQNTVRSERLNFDRLEPYAGLYVQAKGEYSESGKSKRVAVCIGPEHGTVGPDLIKDAAKEAVKGLGNDLLIVCGFAFDPHVSEEAKQYGKLQILITRMNPDLAMGNELLKKTGAGNLFMVFGEPDVLLKKTKDDKFTITIKGLDVYDPTTGVVRSNTTDDIACWFVDTSYNGESFFVRQAYFLGADEPYEKLKKALRAEINEEAWSALYSATSQPFDKPKSGKIAVKVINHYGDEVLKVYEVK